jgi:hypothetical protein
LSQSVQVALVVLDVPQSEADDLQAHLGEVGGGGLLYLDGEQLPVLVDILDHHGTQDRTQVAFQGLLGHVHDLVAAASQELLSGGADGHVCGMDLDLGDAVDDDRIALLGVYLRCAHVDGDDLQAEDRRLLDDRPDECAATLHHLGNSPGHPARDDHGLVGPYLPVTLQDHDDEHEEHQEDRDRSPDYPGVHIFRNNVTGQKSHFRNQCVNALGHLIPPCL